MAFSIGQTAFQLAYEISPIILTNGIATNIPGGMLPIISITEAANFVAGVLSGADINPDNFFAHFRPLPGADLISQEIARFPLANQTVAANATIQNPLRISLLMTCPVRNELGYPLKLAAMTALQTALQQHNTNGGTYTVITPSYFYTNCLLTNLSEVGDAEGKQTQVNWRWDFEQPLLTLQSAQQVQNSLMSKISGGAQIQGSPAWSGLSQTVGQPPSLAGPSIVPAASGAPGAGVSGLSASGGLLA
jgi:hypothetical protein